MPKLTPKQTVELFHLIFLNQLGTKLDKKLYALKGGCNLRFYFNSIRYSEHIDLDIQTIAKHTLQNKVDQLLISTPFKQALKIRKIEMTKISAPKQTEITQRWKIQLSTSDAALPLPTKIEFSRRNKIDGTAFEFIKPHILQNYQLMPIVINHYNFQNALEQKITALALRTETQARDIFDIFQLTSQQKTDFLLENKEWQETINMARSKAATISFREFKDQVIEFLPDEYRSEYESSAIWQQIQKTVDTLLEKLAHATS